MAATAPVSASPLPGWCDTWKLAHSSISFSKVTEDTWKLAHSSISFSKVTEPMPSGSSMVSPGSMRCLSSSPFSSLNSVILVVSSW